LIAISPLPKKLLLLKWFANQAEAEQVYAEGYNEEAALVPDEEEEEEFHHNRGHTDHNSRVRIKHHQN